MDIMEDNGFLAPWDNVKNVTFQLDGDDQWLPDHDHILLEKKCNGDVPADKVRFGLVCSGKWWKGIGVYNGGGSHLSYEIVEVQDAPATTKFGDFPHDNIELYDFILGKAKLLGVHCPMYKI